MNRLLTLTFLVLLGTSGYGKCQNGSEFLSTWREQEVTDNEYVSFAGTGGVEFLSSPMLEVLEWILSGEYENEEEKDAARTLMNFVQDCKEGSNGVVVVQDLLRQIEGVLHGMMHSRPGEVHADIVKDLFVKKGKKTMLFRALDTFWMFVRTNKVAPGITTTTTRRPPVTTTRRTTTTRRRTTTTRRRTTRSTTTTASSSTTTRTTTTTTRAATRTRTTSVSTSVSTTAVSTSAAVTSSSSDIPTGPVDIPGGTAEVTVFLNTDGRTMMNDVCNNRKASCLEEMEESFFRALREESRDMSFSRSMVSTGLLAPRRRGVVLMVYIMEDDDLRIAGFLQKILEDIPSCRQSVVPAICRTPTGAKFANKGLDPVVTSIRVIS
ncbi:transmembrane protein [Cystoisospora suis]|uniref:Transmembrane protein n=1 Tax=Cystoisospora suis TaxID=483139 RepID=A0A2C6K7E2_9APIC|nr:transmembrane protein [Cystoisospora suis]